MPGCLRIRLAVALVLALFLSVPDAAASPDLAKTLNQLKRESRPEVRMRLVRKLDALGGDRAARALAELVWRDPAAGVRIEAAKALGRIRSDEATSLLVHLVPRGGPRAVREAVGKALGLRGDGLKVLRKALASRRAGPRDQGLLIRALGHVRDDGAEEDLRVWLRDPAPHLVEQATRALIERARDTEARRAVIAQMLARGRTLHELMPALESAAGVLDSSLRSGLERAATFLEPPVKAAAEWLLVELDALPPPSPPAAQPPGRRYAQPEPPTPPDGPPPRPVIHGRVDTVYVLDATGSTVPTLESLKTRIVDTMRVLVQSGVNARVGVLLYRGGKTGHGRRAFEWLPLTYDLESLRDWLEEVEPSGVDDRGLRMGEALREALARSAWRWRAGRQVHLLADGPCGDLDIARRAVRVHFRADRTRTRVTWVARSRKDHPSEYDVLTREGGTGTPEIVR